MTVEDKRWIKLCRALSRRRKIVVFVEMYLTVFSPVLLVLSILVALTEISLVLSFFVAIMTSISVALFFTGRKPAQSLLKTCDDKYGWKDSLVTAFEFRNSFDAMALVQRKQVLPLLTKIQPQQVFPLAVAPWLKFCLASVAIFVMAHVLFALYWSKPTAGENLAADRQLSVVKKEQYKKNLAKIAEQVEKAEAESKLFRRKQSQWKKLAEVLKNNPEASDLSRSLRQQNYRQAAKQMKNLAKNLDNSSSRKLFRQNLQEAAEEMEDMDLKKQLRDIADAIKKAENQKQKCNELAKSLEKMAREKRKNKLLQKLKRRERKMAEKNSIQRKRMAVKKQKGAKRRSSFKGDGNRAVNQNRQSFSPNPQIKSKVKLKPFAEEHSGREQQTENSLRNLELPYSKVKIMRKNAEEAIDCEEIPYGYREYLLRYFE